MGPSVAGAAGALGLAAATILADLAAIIVATDMVGTDFGPPQKAIADEIYGAPARVAGLMASDDASCGIGTAYTVDGGMTAA
ncbi:hypothetical protein MASR2M74_17510 [Paracoccaceae bacterium]